MSSEVSSYTYKSGAVYVGTFDGTKRHGRGHWSHPDGESYEGEYINNKQEGYGVYSFSDTGKRYLGSWEGGQMNGLGVYYFSRDYSSFYCGTYLHDKKDGDGYYLYESGILTKQTWKDGELQHETEATPSQVLKCWITAADIRSKVMAVAPKTFGSLTPSTEVRRFEFASGASYTGQYCGTKKHGIGYWVHPEGDSYDGQFEGNKHTGWGVYIIGRSGKKYVGQWYDGRMNGIGVYFFNAEETEYFSGMYKNDLKHGQGIYHFAQSGRSILQQWENGTLKEESEASEASCAAYEAAMRELMEVVKPPAPHYTPVAFK